MYALAAGMQGFLIDDDTWYERIMLIAVAIGLVWPEIISDFLGLAGFAFVYYLQKKRVGLKAVVAA
jgi:TRAP-type uncharacterized transport system fused permease subunit